MQHSYYFDQKVFNTQRMFKTLFLPFRDSYFSLPPSLVISACFFTEALKNEILFTSR